uniref:Uncharacterized protein n=1 Tax=Arundo donax TaxID=35708 RepID=A0A0A9A4Q0_ARUDO
MLSREQSDGWELRTMWMYGLAENEQYWYTQTIIIVDAIDG